jgi:phage head maturation protease
MTDGLKEYGSALLLHFGYLGFLTVRDTLRAVAEFPPEEMATPRSREVHNLVKAGVLRAASLGFRPLDPPTKRADGVLVWSRAELYEWSVVNVPANPYAVRTSAKDLELAFKAFAQQELPAMVKAAIRSSLAGVFR